ncbi:hypothetical protein HHK36_008872 [Tetracentron sinense]|uniref:PhoD-like phosphatase metallophosphatase domain-containing protein n=1 Tax=Tetracentron sinense TaxID=13715 RepID=A0A834ZJU2_TETSI|nr:hypothetical protein HHK36_008872 [Tetracentron sinense]
MIGRVSRFRVEAKIVEIQGVEIREGFALKITERNNRNRSCSLWVPDEAIFWLSKTITEFIDSSGYCFRKFRGSRCSLMGEKRSNERGEFLSVQSFFGEGAGGRVFIPKGNRSSGWYALLSALGSGFPSRESHPVGGEYEGGRQYRKMAFKGWRVKPNKGVECRIEKVGSSSLVVELAAGDAKNWELAVVCSIGGPEESDDWEEVTRLSSSIPIPVGHRNVVGFRRWWPEANSLSFTCFKKPRWLAVKGIPFHLWIPGVLGKVGALCGGLVEIHPSTAVLSDLSFAKIKVSGELNLIPRRISIVYQSIIYPVELSVWEVELCDNCKMWPESMEIRYHRSWVVAEGGISGKVKPSVQSGLDAINRDSGQISYFKLTRVEPDLIPANTGGEYGAYDSREVAGELIFQQVSNRRIHSAEQSVGLKKGRRQARNRKRRARRLRLWSESVQGVRSASSRAAEEKAKATGPVPVAQECEYGPRSNGPNQMGKTLSYAEARLVDTDWSLVEARPSCDQVIASGSGDPLGFNSSLNRNNTIHALMTSTVFPKSLGFQSEARDQAIGGSSSIDPLFRRVESEVLEIDWVDEIEHQRSRLEFPIGESELLAKNHSEVSKVADTVVRQSSEEGVILQEVSPNSFYSSSCSSPPGQFLGGRFWSDDFEDRDLESNTPLVFSDLASLPKSGSILSKVRSPISSQGKAEAKGDKVLDEDRCEDKSEGLSASQPIWNAIIDFDPQLFIWLGDNIYGDIRRPYKLFGKERTIGPWKNVPRFIPISEHDMESRYEKAKSNPGYSLLRERTLVIGTWDDHDYGLNDAGKEFSGKDISQRLLLDFLDEPQDSPRRKQAGVYASYTFGPEGKQIKVILLDTRYHRDPLFSDGSILGSSQWAWLEKELKGPASAITIIASSIQVVSNLSATTGPLFYVESWGRFPKERERLFKLIGDSKRDGVFFISGDVHFGEVTRFDCATGYPLYDITSSGLTQAVEKAVLSPLDSVVRFVAWLIPTTMRVIGPKCRYRSCTYGQQNFGAIEIDWDATPVTMKIEVRDVNGAPVISVNISLLDLQTRRTDHGAIMKAGEYRRHCTLEVNLSWIVRYRLACLFFCALAGA